MSESSAFSGSFLQYDERGDVLLPFTVNSDVLASKSLVCSKQLRLLPGRRLVCQADYAGTNVLVKLFFGADYRRRWLREVDGVGYIGKSGIRTPRLLEAGVDPKKKMAFAIFEFIEEARTLDELRSEDSFSDSKVGLLKKALSIVAKMHDSSIYQKDIHLDNFLTTGGEIFLVDGDQVCSKTGQVGLPAELVVNNLAMFFTQIYPWEDELIEGLYDYYRAERKLDNPEVTLLAVKNKLQEHRLWREKKYIQKKVFRGCSAFNVIQDWTIFSVFSRDLSHHAAKCFIQSPDTFIDNGDILKSGRTATVAKIKLNGKSYIAKRYNRKSFHHQLARCLMESRSAVSWRNGHLLQFNGIPTAKPLLMLERRIGFMRFGSYVLTEYRKGLHAFDFFKKEVGSCEAEVMAHKIAKLVNSLHKCRLVHGDLKSHNIWITENEPILIDLDGMRKVDDSHGALVDKDWSRLKRDLGDSEVATILFDK